MKLGISLVTKGILHLGRDILSIATKGMLIRRVKIVVPVSSTVRTGHKRRTEPYKVKKSYEIKGKKLNFISLELPVTGNLAVPFVLEVLMTGSSKWNIKLNDLEIKGFKEYIVILNNDLFGNKSNNIELSNDLCGIKLNSVRKKHTSIGYVSRKREFIGDLLGTKLNSIDINSFVSGNIKNRVFLETRIKAKSNIKEILVALGIFD